MTFEEFTKFTTVDDNSIFQDALEEFKHLNGISPEVFCTVWAYRNQHNAFRELRLIMSIEKQEWAMAVENTVYDPEYRKIKYAGFKEELEDCYSKNFNKEKGVWKGRKQFGPGVDKNKLSK